VAPPTAVIPAVAIMKPFPLPSLQVTPAGDEPHVNGPSVIVCPYCNVGVPSPGFERHCWPVHLVTVPSVFRTADCAGENVKHEVCVIMPDPKLLSISQLMFIVGEKNSVLVEVWGCRVGLIGTVVVVRRGGTEDVEPDALVEVVVPWFEEPDPPLEHAANRAAPLTNTRVATTRRVEGYQGISRA
jgi:hypothetical protein